MKPLLVGEANPHQTDERMAMRYALHPDPPHASGGRLCRVVMGLDEETYLRSFDRTDLCHPRWSLPMARRRALELAAERTAGDVIVLCGAKVANAFGVAFDPFTVVRGRHNDSGIFMRYDVHGLPAPSLVVIPHPSGLNRAWHAPGAVAQAREVLARAGVLPQGVLAGGAA